MTIALIYLLGILAGFYLRGSLAVLQKSRRRLRNAQIAATRIELEKLVQK